MLYSTNQFNSSQETKSPWTSKGACMGSTVLHIVLTFLRPFHESASDLPEGGSPEIGAPSAIFCRGSPHKQGVRGKWWTDRMATRPWPCLPGTVHGKNNLVYWFSDMNMGQNDMGGFCSQKVALMTGERIWCWKYFKLVGGACGGNGGQASITKYTKF